MATEAEKLQVPKWLQWAAGPQSSQSQVGAVPKGLQWAAGPQSSQSQVGAVPKWLQWATRGSEYHLPRLGFPFQDLFAVSAQF